MKILPYNDEQPFLCYHCIAFPIGIITGNVNGDLTKWICSKMINCQYDFHSPDHKFDFFVDDIWGVKENIISYQSLSLSKETIDILEYDWIPVLQRFIDNQFYIVGTYNEKYIPGKSAYNQFDFTHDYLIIGYDDECFISVGYLADNKLQRFKIPFKNMIESLYNVENDNIFMGFLKFNDTAKFEYSLLKIAKDLDDYLGVENSPNNITSDVIFGIETNHSLKNFFVDEVKVKNFMYVDKRYTRVLMEHKWVLMKLVEEFLGTQITQYSMLSKENYNKAKTIHLLGLKMQFAPNISIVDRISTLLDEIVENEKLYIPNLINELKMKYNT